MCEKITRFAIRDAALFANYQYDVDVLKAIPIEKYSNSNFIEKRYPQMVKTITDKRESFSDRMQRRIDQFGHDISRSKF